MTFTFSISSGTKTKSGETKYEADINPKPSVPYTFRDIIYDGNTLRGSIVKGDETVKSYIQLYVADQGTLSPGKYQFDTEKNIFSVAPTASQGESGAGTVPNVEQSSKTMTLGPGPADPKQDPIYTAIVRAMDSLVATFDNLTAKGVDLDDFSSPSGDYYTEIKSAVEEFKRDPLAEYEYGQSIEDKLGSFDFTDSGILSTIAGYASADKEDTVEGKALRAKLLVKGIKAPIDGLPQMLKTLAKDENIKLFLIDGLSNNLTGKTRPPMFARLRDFTNFLGEDTYKEFIAAIRELEAASASTKSSEKEAEPTETSEKNKQAPKESPSSGSTSDTVRDTASAAGEVIAGAAASVTGISTAGSNVPTTPPVEMGEAPKKEEPSDTVLFRYTLFGADPKSDAKMTLTFQDGSGLEYTIPSSRIGSVNTFIVNGNNREKIAANVDTYVDVKIDATPMGGGEAVTDTQSVYVTKQLADNQIFSYRFMPSLGWGKNTGVDSRGKTVGDLINKEGDVRMVFYTRSGSVSVATCDVSASVAGKMFKFNFAGNQPLLVPIQLEIVPGKLNESFVKKTRRLLNEAVPHWIFLKGSAATGAGTGGGGGDAGGAGGKGGKEGGGDGSGKQTMNVNIAVSQVMIASEDKWIYMPNVGNPFDRGSFRFTVAPGSIKKYSAIPDTAQQVTLAADELSKQGYTQQQIADKVYEALFEDSDAWKRVGGPNLNCWSKDDTVVGGSSSITSRHAYEPVRVS